MNDYVKFAVTGLIILLMFACFKRQRRYWREMNTSRPTGSLRAGYKLAIFTVFLALSAAAYSNTEAGWQVFMSIMLMVIVFCVKITFSPAVIGLVLAMCTYQLHVHDRFPFFEIWGSALSVLSWRLPEEFRIFYTTLSFLWVMAILLGGGQGSAEAAAAEDVADATSVLHG